MTNSDPTAAFSLPAAMGTDVRLCSMGASVTVRGEIDIHTSRMLHAQLAEVVGQGEERVFVHLDEVTFMDSTGLGVLIGARRDQMRQGGSLELVCSQPRLLRLLALTGLDQVFVVHEGQPGGPS